ncbi:hypothetical protein U9M48_023944 [Paspalum notatum var. saurae]|uniref:Gag-pol polyprotein n=1 Tax=Paspalum notatum var. saurae TaxID=547442 RepID=A0AAQ3WV66_PASNO
MADPANGSPSADDVQAQERRREEEAKAAEERRLKEVHDKEVEDRRRADLDNSVAHTAPAEPFLNTQGMNTAALLAHMGKIDKLKGPNYPTWRKDIDMMFTLTDMDFALLYDKPTEPAPGEARYDDKMLHYSIEKRKWEISNTKCLKIIRHLIDDSIEGSIPECATAKELRIDRSLGSSDPPRRMPAPW